ncbi:MAG: hypothetical protein AAGF31_05405, partial [Planctomycetota bacterium]
SRRKIADATDATIATVAGRLVRGKRMLRQRLARRGVSLAVAAGVFVGSNAVAAEGVSSTATTTISPPPPFDPTAAASTAVAHLVTQGVRSMLFASLAKPVAIAAVSVTAAALLLAGPSTDAGASSGAQQLVLDSGAEETPPTDTPAVRIAQQPPAAAEESGAEVAIDSTNSPAPAVETILVPMDLDKQREEAEMVARARAHWAKKARAESGIDLSQPSFAELFKMRTYWSAMENAAESELERLQRSMKSQPNNVTAKQVTEAFAQIQQAKAKQLELERQMKLAALREEAAERPAESNPASDSAASSRPSNRSGGLGGRGGFRNRPAAPPEAASPTQPPSAAVPAERRNDEVFRDAANSLAFTLLNEAIKRPRDEFLGSNDPLPRAKALFARFLDEGQSYRALVGMAQCLDVEGDHDAALEYWQRAYAIKPHNRIDEGLSLLEWIAHNYARPGLWSLAEPWLQRVLKEKGNPHIEPYAGWLLKANSEWQKARRNAAANYTPPSTDSEVHVVGTYNGADGAPLTVEVKKTDKPITLVLSAYYWQDWQLEVVAGATLERVIVAGYNGQRIAGVLEGLPEGVPLDVYSYFPTKQARNDSPRPPSFSDREYFWAYKETSEDYFDLVEKLGQLVDAEIAEFHGGYSADSFVIE